jgi:hypothetical protein
MSNKVNAIRSVLKAEGSARRQLERNQVFLTNDHGSFGETSPFDFRGLVQLLRELRPHVATDEFAALRLSYADWATVRDTFPAPSYSLPGANVGQVADARYSVAGSSLHWQLFRDFIELHLDDPDPLVSPIEHAAQATHALEYGLWGGVGVVLATLFLTRDARATRLLGGLGVSTGVILGAHRPKQRRRVFRLSDFVAAWRRCA